jgi:hypothetical protein
MTRYNDFCAEFFAQEPQAVEIDRIFRQTPVLMRDAIRRHFEPPDEVPVFPMPLAGKPTSYVSLYRPGLDQNGEKHWEQCGGDEGLLVGSDEIGRFVIGVFMQNPSTSMEWSRTFFTFSIESVTLKSVVLQIEKWPGEILIEPFDEKGFLKAAEKAVDSFLAILKKLSEKPGNRNAIGFRVQRNEDA